jgi:hypothetical protein
MAELFRKVSLVALGLATFAFYATAAEAACKFIKATHSALSHADAAQMSRALALQSANDLKRAKGWSYANLTAHRVKGDPFWKMVRPDGVPQDAQLRPDLVTSRFYTTCFTGVVVPYVCTTGSNVCGQ